MGGSSKTMEQVSQIDPSLQNITAQTPPWLQGGGSMTMPQAGPGQLAMLGQQLAAGGFGTPKTNSGWLDTIYDPVVMQDYRGAKPKPRTTTNNTTPTPPAPKPRGGDYKPGGRNSR